MSNLTQSSTTSTPTTIDVDHLIELVSKLPPEPVGEWMRSKGCPPEDWSVVMPIQMRPGNTHWWPDYVIFSPAVDQPVFINRKEALPLFAQREQMRGRKPDSTRC